MNSRNDELVVQTNVAYMAIVINKSAIVRQEYEMGCCIIRTPCPASVAHCTVCIVFIASAVFSCDKTAVTTPAVLSFWFLGTS